LPLVLRACAAAALRLYLLPHGSLYALRRAGRNAKITVERTLCLLGSAPPAAPHSRRNGSCAPGAQRFARHRAACCRGRHGAMRCAACATGFTAWFAQASLSLRTAGEQTTLLKTPSVNA